MSISRRSLLAQGTTALVAGAAAAAPDGWNLSGGARLDRSTLVLESVAAPGALAHLPRTAFPARFSLTFRARFRSLGLADESTGDRATFQILLAGDAAGTPFSLVVTLLFDRFNVEPRYKVLRTDDRWHRWRLDVDPATRTIALWRDGRYLALHAFDAPAEPGLRFVARGSDALAAKVDLADVAVAALPVPTERRPTAARRRTPVADGDWPQWRRDPGQSGVAALSGDLRRARTAGRIEVPGTAAVRPVFVDLDGDGAPEALVAHGGNLTARRADDSVLWRLRLDAATFLGMHDLDGDGRDELLVSAGNPSRLHVLDPRTGAVRFVSPHRPRAGVAGIKVGRLNPARRGLQVVVWAHLDEIGYCLSFDQGIERGALEWTFDWKMSFFTPLVALADMDRDGLPELVAVTYNHVFVYDGRTGAVKTHLEWNSGRNYGTLVVQDVDGDGYPDLVVLADVLREHVAVLKNEGGTGLRVLWDRFTEQNYPDDHAALRVLTESVGDFDGDGRTEVVWSVFDDRVDRRWRTLVVDAVTGQTKRTFGDAWLAAAGTLWPGKPPVLVLSRPASRDELGAERLAVWSASGDKVCDLPPGRVVADRTAADFAPHQWGQVSGIATGTPTTAIQTVGGRAALGLRTPDGRAVLTLALTADGRPETLARHTVPEGRTVDTADIVRGSVGTAGADGRYRVYAGGAARSDLDCRGGTIVQPIVARIRPGDAPSVLFIDPSGVLRCVGGDDDRERWSVKATGCHSFYIPNSRPHGIPVAADIDGDGVPEVLVAQGRNLVALGPDGAVKRSWGFPGPPQFWSVGDFDGDGRTDLLVTWARGAILDVVTVVVSGRTGKVVWEMQGGNGPSAVGDVDGDGRDDVVTRDLYERRLWRGTDGRDLQPIEMQAGYHTPVLPPGPYDGVWWLGGSWSAMAEDRRGAKRWMHWLAPTGTGCVADLDGTLCAVSATSGNIYALPDLHPIDGPNQEVLCHDARTGALRWSFPLGATTPGMVAGDVDGDGRREIVLGASDGRLIALGADGTVRWERTLPAALGVPLLCDADGDGRLDLLVPCADGRIHRFAGGAR